MILETQKTIKIATWNINSIRKRHDVLTSFLEKEKPDVVLLQETKCPDDKFPEFDFLCLGYKSAINGNIKNNGVAILSCFPILKVDCNLGNNQWNDGRYIQATLGVGGDTFTISSVYAPCGGSPFDLVQNIEETERFQKKLSFYRELYKKMKAEKSIYAGDFNICPTENDMFSSSKKGYICCSEKEFHIFKCLLALGYIDTFRAKNSNERCYSWWDTAQHHYISNKGLRLDHILIPNENKYTVESCHIDLTPMNHPIASDHAPVICLLSKFYDKQR